MKILVAHNSYQYRGGEDAAVDTETRQLEAHGDTVIPYRRHNDELREISPLSALTHAAETIWASRSAQDIAQLVSASKPDIAHFHNTFPLISPSAYYACSEAGVPVVQTLHNYRLICPAATLMRKGKVCESCLGRGLPWPGIVRRCYRDSTAQTASLAAMLAAHTAMGTWHNKIDIYVALSEFAKLKFVQGGFPGNRIVVKPNFVHPDPGPKNSAGEYALFVGRLSEEKGPRVLLNAWRELAAKLPLFILGDGPLRDPMEAQIKKFKLSNITIVGEVPPDRVFQWMHNARFLISASLCYECFPVSVVEAFACGLPVIASELGSLAEIVAPGRTGLHFTAGDATELARAVDWAWSHSDHVQRMGQQARLEFERKYTAERNYRSLMHIYDQLLDQREESRFGRGLSFSKAAS
jgi:glycosyltransferase involved in cell wall biosynthesis